MRWLVGGSLCLGALNLHPGTAAAQGARDRVRAPVGAHEFREVHLGMEMRMVVVHASVEDAAAIARRAFDLVERHEAALSDWRPQSEVRRLERAEPGSWVNVSSALSDVLALALRVARESGGAFDPTVGPLTELWREGRRTGTPIDEARREAALARVGYGHVELDTGARRVRLAVRGMRLDLGAVAKGWILDRAIQSLVDAGATAALVEAGGDLVAHGAPPGARGWRIDVPGAAGDTVVVITGGAVSSSGPSAQRIAGRNGRPESHVIDPRTGRGAPDEEIITVMGPNGATADALATALALTPRANRDALALRFGVTMLAPGGRAGDRAPP